MNKDQENQYIHEPDYNVFSATGRQLNMYLWQQAVKKGVTGKLRFQEIGKRWYITHTADADTCQKAKSVFKKLAKRYNIKLSGI